MKKLMIGTWVWLCISMQVQGYTIAKIGAKEVHGNAYYVDEKGIKKNNTFSIKSDRGYIDRTDHRGEGDFIGDRLELSDGTNMKHGEVYKNMTLFERYSAFTILLINADANPVTVSWHIDKEGALDKQYEDRKAALKRDKDRQINHLIESLVKEGERKAKSAPGGPSFE